jgi:hypothetical protein
LLEDLKSPVLGLLIGAGSEFKNILPVPLILEMRYNIDLTNSYNNSYIIYRNKVLEFNIGARF